jgi:hypothetical protein
MKATIFARLISYAIAATVFVAVALPTTQTAAAILS